MRWLLVTLLAGSVGANAGCGAASAPGPAWPKAAAKETDGGESLAPRQPKVATLENDADELEIVEDKPATAAPAATTATAAAGTAAAAITTSTTASPEEVIITEEIVIEIDD